MLTPKAVCELILTWHTNNPTEASERLLDGLASAGYVIVPKSDYMGLASAVALAKCGSTVMEVRQ